MSSPILALAMLFSPVAAGLASTSDNARPTIRPVPTRWIAARRANEGCQGLQSLEAGTHPLLALPPGRANEAPSALPGGRGEKWGTVQGLKAPGNARAPSGRPPLRGSAPSSDVRGTDAELAAETDGAGGAQKASSLVIWAGLGVVVVAAGMHLRRDGVDPFLRGIPRGNRLTPALVMFPAAAYVFAYLLLDPVQSWLTKGGSVQTAQQVRNTSAQLVGALTGLALGHACFRGGIRAFLIGPRGWARALLGSLGYVLAASALCDVTYFGTETAIRLLRPGYEFFEHRVIQALRDPQEPLWAPLVLWFGAVIVAPIAEEGFFRGLLQTGVLRRVHRRGIAVAGAALVFGIAHMDQPHVLPAMMMFGLVVGLQYERSGGLLGPIATHALFNLKSLIMEWWTRSPA